jgi:hypothetical protein
MGILKWILKNGPGSPGSSAKAIAKSYNKCVSVSNEVLWREIFLKVFQIRKVAGELISLDSGSLVSEVDLDKVIEYSDGDLRILSFQLMYIESERFRRGIQLADQETLSLTIEVIDETIHKMAPNAIALNTEDFVWKILNLIKNPLLLK